MTFCTQCGTGVADDDAFCTSCGAAAGSGSATSQVVTMAESPLNTNTSETSPTASGASPREASQPSPSELPSYGPASHDASAVDASPNPNPAAANPWLSEAARPRRARWLVIGILTGVALTALVAVTVVVHPFTPTARPTTTSNMPTSVAPAVAAAQSAPAKPTLAAIATITVGTVPTAVAITPDGRHVWVADVGSSDKDNILTTADLGGLTVFDTTTNQVTAIAAGSHPQGVAVAPDGHHVYAADGGSGTLTEIDTNSGTITATVHTGSDPDGVAVAPDGAHVYVTNAMGNSVSVIDTAGHIVIATVPVGAQPVALAVSPDGRHVYAVNHNAGTVSVIDTADNTVSATVAVGAGPYSAAVTPDGTRLFVTNNGPLGSPGTTVSVIDTKTDSVAATITTGVAPTGVAITPDGARAYITEDRMISLIDTTTYKIVTTVTVAYDAKLLVLSPDGTKAYITDFDKNVLSVVNLHAT